MFPLQNPHIIKILFIGILIALSLKGFSQTIQWNLIEGKAITQKKISIAGKNSSDLYKEVNRWLIVLYHDTEEIFKARLEGEYIRGVGYASNCLKQSFPSAPDLQYTFTFEIKNEEVIFKIFDVFVIHTYSQDDDGIYPVENYIFTNEHRKKEHKKDRSELVLSSLTEFSNSMFQSLENHLIHKK